ncbi:MAG: WYL domain-containing protein [Actinomycetota bacterium]
MNKLERLLNLTAVLLATPRPLTAEELRTRVEGYPPAGAAFHRAFERDKDDLRVLGIPLKVERAPATDPPVDGYRIDPDEYYLPDPGLDPDELAALHLASLTVRLDGSSDHEALWKLGGVGEATGDAPPSLADLPSDESLAPLFSAIVASEQVRFGYRGETRTVDPWRLDFERGRWYLAGHDLDRDAERNFRLDRIEGTVEAVGPALHPRARSVDAPAGPRPAWELGPGHAVAARIRVDADYVESARRQLGPNADMQAPAVPADHPAASDGSVDFVVPVTNHDAFRSFVLGFLHRAELIEPAEWRDDIVCWLDGLRAPTGQVNR